VAISTNVPEELVALSILKFVSAPPVLLVHAKLIWVDETAVAVRRLGGPHRYIEY
jgi:hypothetical protein